MQIHRENESNICLYNYLTILGLSANICVMMLMYLERRGVPCTHSCNIEYGRCNSKTAPCVFSHDRKLQSFKFFWVWLTVYSSNTFTPKYNPQRKVGKRCQNALYNESTFEYPFSMFIFMPLNVSIPFGSWLFRADAGSFTLGVMGREGHPDKGASLGGRAVLQGGWTERLEAQSSRCWGCFPPGISTLFQHIPQLWRQSGPGWAILVDRPGEGYFLTVQSARACPAWCNG